LLPHNVTALTDALVPAIRGALGDNLTAAYVAGSLALGSFDPETSDVDLLVITERPLTDDEIAVLTAVHRRIPPEASNGSGHEYEAYYVDRSTVRRFAPGQLQAKVEPGQPLYRTEHRPAMVFERWVVREHGVVLHGPDPKLLIDPVSAQDLAEAAAGELRARWHNWSTGKWPHKDIALLGSQGYEVETVCRALYTIECGEMVSKRDAVAWALTHLPAEWRPLIEWSQTIRKQWTRDATRADEVLRFLERAVSNL
jgi:hypothetical protein